MIKKIVIGLLLVICYFVVKSTIKDKSTGLNKGNIAEIDLKYDFKIIIPTLGGEFDSCKHYINFEVWQKNKEVYKDTTQNEYRFLCNKLYTNVRKLVDNRYELLIEMFDGPDIDKSFVLYIKDGELEDIKLLPFFEDAPEKIDGKMEYHGIMHTIDGYQNDSCFYNPTLYYAITDHGTILDTLVTKRKNSEIWGDFYGFEQSDKIILLCNH
jgi:hypothetical protein